MGYILSLDDIKICTSEDKGFGIFAFIYGSCCVCSLSLSVKSWQAF